MARSGCALPAQADRSRPPALAVNSARPCRWTWRSRVPAVVPRYAVVWSTSAYPKCSMSPAARNSRPRPEANGRSASTSTGTGASAQSPDTPPEGRGNDSGSRWAVAAASMARATRSFSAAASGTRPDVVAVPPRGCIATTSTCVACASPLVVNELTAQRRFTSPEWVTTTANSQAPARARADSTVS